MDISCSLRTDVRVKLGTVQVVDNLLDGRLGAVPGPSSAHFLDRQYTI